MEKKLKIKRLIALIGVILMGICAVGLLVTAFVDSLYVYFRGFLILMIALPITLWITIWAYGAMMNKHSIASFDVGKTGDYNEEKNDE